MRLTRAWATNEEGKAIEYITIPVDDMKVQVDVWRKLGQLEDIEEELGIDLVTLFKALKQKYICLLLEDNVIYEYGKINTIEYDQGVFNTRFGYYGFKDYGKTWALTKEELL